MAARIYDQEYYVRRYGFSGDPSMRARQLYAIKVWAEFYKRCEGGE